MKSEVVKRCLVAGHTTLLIECIIQILILKYKHEHMVTNAFVNHHSLPSYMSIKMSEEEGLMKRRIVLTIY